MNNILQLAIAYIVSVDDPDARKLQKTPVPVLGGIAVFFGLLFELMVFEGLGFTCGGLVESMVNGSSASLVPHPSTLIQNILPVLLASICFKRADYANCALALCFAGALLPSLMHNVFGKRSKMFIDDAGTMVMGL